MKCCSYKIPPTFHSCKSLNCTFSDEAHTPRTPQSCHSPREKELKDRQRLICIGAGCFDPATRVCMMRHSRFSCRIFASSSAAAAARVPFNRFTRCFSSDPVIPKDPESKGSTDEKATDYHHLKEKAFHAGVVMQIQALKKHQILLNAPLDFPTVLIILCCHPLFQVNRLIQWLTCVLV